MRVLVVDDDGRAAEGLATILQFWGHEASEAHDGPAAIAAARARRPEVVLLDIGLPGIDGLQVARQIREGMESGAPLLIALTGHVPEGDPQRYRDAGFDHYLVKPVDLEILQSLLTQAESCGGAMERFHGRLWDGGRLLFERATVGLGSEAGSGRCGVPGRLEVHQGGILGRDLATDRTYRLVLDDGRAGDVRFTKVFASNSAGIATMEFEWSVSRFSPSPGGSTAGRA